MRARSVNFERGKDPKSSIGIGKNRFGKSKMGENSGYEVIWSDGNWNIEKYLNPNTGKYSIVVVGHDDGEDPDDVWDQTEYPILYDDGRVGYDNPYNIPNYVRDIVRELYPSIRESISFQRGQDPKRVLGIGIWAKLENLAKLLEDELHWNGASVEVQDDGSLLYLCMAGNSVIGDIKEVIEKFGWGKMMKVNIADDCSRNYPDCEFHTYKISFKAPLRRKYGLSESLDFQRGQNPKEALDIGLANKAFPIISITSSPYNTVEEYFKKILETTGFITPHYAIHVIKDPDFKGAVSRQWDLQDLELRGYTGIKYKGLFLPFEKYVNK